MIAAVCRYSGRRAVAATDNNAGHEKGDCL